jgi:hypothetical protein
LKSLQNVKNSLILRIEMSLSDATMKREPNWSLYWGLCSDPTVLVFVTRLDFLSRLRLSGLSNHICWKDRKSVV